MSVRPCLLTLLAAFCLALGAVGGATAVVQVTGADIEDGTLTTKDVKSSTLKTVDFAGSVQGPRGDRGATGPTGAPGPDAGAGYSWVARASGGSIPAMSSGQEFTVTCPAGTTVLGGSGRWDRPLDLLDSRQVTGQEAWVLRLGNASGNTTAHVNVYAWCAGMTAPAVVP